MLDGQPANILLLTLDTVRPDHLGCYGYSRSTPWIDRLARDGAVFDQAVTNGSYTKTAFPPILSSTYASMFNGPFFDVSANRPMLAEILREHGYQTIGITSNPLLGEHIGYDAGFDRFCELTPPVEDRDWLDWTGIRRLLGVPLVNSTLAALGLDTKPHPVYVRGQEVTDLAIDALSEDTAPMFVWLHYMDAHWPYHTFSQLETGRDKARAWADMQTMWASRNGPANPQLIARARGLYDEGIRHLDAEIGRLVRQLEDRGLLMNTLIILTSDHGEAFYEHGRWGHGAVLDFHEEILRVPLLIRYPMLAGGTRVSELVSLIDIAPTILDAVGIEAEPEMEGASLLPTLLGSGSTRPAMVISEMIDRDWQCIALRTERYKFIFNERTPDLCQLYDLKNDPSELVDLYGELRSVEAEFHIVLEQHLKRIRGTGSRDSQGNWQIEPTVEDRLRALGYLD